MNATYFTYVPTYEDSIRLGLYLHRDVSEICYFLKSEFPLVKGNILSLETCQKCFLSNCLNATLDKKWIPLWPNYHGVPIYLSDNPPNLPRPAPPSENHLQSACNRSPTPETSNKILWLTYSLNHPCFELLECPCMYGMNNWTNERWWPATHRFRGGGTRLQHLPEEWGVTTEARSMMLLSHWRVCSNPHSWHASPASDRRKGQKERYQFLQ